MNGVIQKVRLFGGTKYETMDGAFSRASVRHKTGYNRRKARRMVNKKIRQKIKKEMAA